MIDGRQCLAFSAPDRHGIFRNGAGRPLDEQEPTPTNGKHRNPEGEQQGSLHAFILPRPTQTRNSGRAEHCLVLQRQWPWNRGAPRYWSLACRQNGPAPATKYFSGNGIAVASMCGVLH